MDRGAWQATVFGAERPGYNLMTKQQQHGKKKFKFYFGTDICSMFYYPFNKLFWVPALVSHSFTEK